MNIRLAFAAIILIAGIASASAQTRSESGQTGYLTSNVLGCPDRGKTLKLLDLAEKNFDAAVLQGMVDKCKTFEKGTEIFINQAGVNLSCIIDRKVRGDCMWTASSRIFPID